MLIELECVLEGETTFTTHFLFGVPCDTEPVCNRTWDGWLCWDDTKAGYTTEQHCPDYFQDFDPSGDSLKLAPLAYHYSTSKNTQWFTVAMP